MNLSISASEGAFCPPNNCGQKRNSFSIPPNCRVAVSIDGIARRPSSIAFCSKGKAAVFFYEYLPKKYLLWTEYESIQK